MAKRKFLKWLLVSSFALSALVALLISPIDRAPLQDQPFFSQMMSRLDTLEFRNSGTGKIYAGWAKVNITPSHNMPMAGYKMRDHFDAVHDSLYARVLMVNANGKSVALINVDLLLFPPALKKRLEEKLAEHKAQIFLYLSATHTHNGIGGWDQSLGGQLALGDYNSDWVEETAERITQTLISQTLIPSTVKYWESDADDLVVNRIAYSKGEKDGRLRGLIIEREDSTKACLFTFSAHATSIRKKNYSLSADYPGRVIQQIEKQFDFGMFMAGMVGSHSFKSFPEQDYELIENESALLVKKFIVRRENKSVDSMSISTAHVPIEFGPSQLRIFKNWKVRNWVFNSLLPNLQGELTYLRLGNIIMIGTPCDFSGEIFVRNSLESIAGKQGKHLIITSFNGNYTGYVTYDGHYDSIDNAEVRELNWVGPYYGEYFSTMIKKLLSKEVQP